MEFREWEKLRNWVCTLPCSVCGGGVYHDSIQQMLCDPCHVDSKGSTASRVHFNNLIPMCRRHHTQQHAQGWNHMGKLYGFDKDVARARAVKITKEYVLNVKEKPSVEGS